MASSEASKEAIYLKRFATEMGIHDESPVELHGDNKGAIDLAYNPEHHSRTKHIDRRHFYVREMVENGEIVVPYVQTDDNLADFFTKPLSAKKFFSLRDKIMNVPTQSRDALTLMGILSPITGGCCYSYVCSHRSRVSVFSYQNWVNPSAASAAAQAPLGSQHEWTRHSQEHG